MSRANAKTKTKRAKKGSTSGVRGSWKGMLRFGLVAFPVRAVNAHGRESERLAFHLLHKACHSRIHYEKVCPIHGPVSNDEIVSGYEYTHGKYVEFDPEELDELRTEKERALTIDTFVPQELIDPIYFDGRMYFLAPDGSGATNAYAVFLESLNRTQRWGIGHVVFAGKQQLALVRPEKNVLQMAMLNYAAEIKSPAAAVGELPHAAPRGKEIALAIKLIENWSENDFDFSDYVDRYEQEVRKLIDAKIHGRKDVAPKIEEEPEIVNLMDALRKSVGQTKTRHASGNGAHHPVQHSVHRKTRRPAGRKRRAS